MASSVSGKDGTPYKVAASHLITTCATMAAILLAMGGCSTTNLQPMVDVPVQFAMPVESAVEPEVAWWESYGDPVLTDLIRR